MRSVVVAVAVVGLVLGACSDDGSTPASTTTTIRPRVPSATELGSDFAAAPPDDVGSTACAVVLPDQPAPVERSEAAYVSNAALELAAVELLDFADTATAREAWEGARAQSSCEADGSGPTDVDVAGAERAFSIGFADPNDGVGMTVALVDATIVVATARFHFGAATSDGIGSDALAALAIARLFGTAPASPLDPRLPDAEELGPAFYEALVRTGRCTAAVPAAVTAYASGHTLQRVTVELFEHVDAAAAEAAATSMRDDDACAPDGSAVEATIVVSGATVVAATVERLLPNQEPAGGDTTSAAAAAVAVARLEALANVTAAIRLACRRFYGADHDPAGPSRTLTAAELVARCDVPPVEWRTDCYALRPRRFTVGDGGCAHLGGYLAVWAGADRPEATADHVFEVDGTTWTILPESD